MTYVPDLSCLSEDAAARVLSATGRILGLVRRQPDAFVPAGKVIRAYAITPVIVGLVVSEGNHA